MSIIISLFIGGILCIGFSRPLAIVFSRIGRQSWSRTPFANSELINFLYGEKVTRTCFIIIGIVWMLLGTALLYGFQQSNGTTDQEAGPPLEHTDIEADKAPLE